MKKPYISPEIRIETFVANESVTSCYTVTCNGMNSDILTKKGAGPGGLPCEIDHLNDIHDTHGVVASHLRNEPETQEHVVEYIVSGYPFVEFIEYAREYNGHWGVVVEDEATTAHPNASN